MRRFPFVSTLLLAALLLTSCAPVPVDDTLIEGSECMFDSDCQSGHCWQADSEETATCKATPEPADA